MKFEKVYQDMVNDLHPSSELKDKLIQKEEKRMKFQKKKFVIAAVAACMLLGTTVYAAGHIATYRSWADPSKKTTDFVVAEQKAQETGSQLTIPRAFSNGYVFDSANDYEREGLDENGNVLVKSKDFFAAYVKEESPDISMFINQMQEAEDDTYAVEKKTIGDVEVCFNQAIYKFVPEGYELTEEDKQNMEDSHYEISYGSEEVEEKTYTGISFTVGGKCYNMFAWDCDMTVEEWYQMAQELIER